MDGDSASADGGPISMVVDPAKNRYPFAIVWGLLPPLTWIFPLIGHMGICDSRGRVHDFAGPYFIGVSPASAAACFLKSFVFLQIDDFMAGPVMMYWQINPEDFIKGDKENAAKIWDQAIEKADGDYAKLMHNICW
jgi:hypothetical protein